jgi:hypothetical protein
MILVPLALTAQVVHCNVWTYMLFGSVYAGKTGLALLARQYIKISYTLAQRS